jgi:hypothetical protein
MNINAGSAQKTAFFDDFFGELAKVPFGAMAKRDLDWFLLNLMLKHDVVKYESNRKLANALCVNETRLKGYLVDMRYKYGQDQQEANVRAIITDIFINGSTKVSYDDGYFVFSVEDPVKKLDFFQAMKDNGVHADTSFSDEIVKVTDYALLSFLLACDKDSSHRKFKELVQKDAELVKAVNEIKAPGAARNAFCAKLITSAASIVGAAVTGSPVAAGVAAGVELLRQIASAISG